MLNEINPEQVPNAVVDALWEITGDHPVGVLASRHEAKMYLAAALSAWPGMLLKLDGRYALLPLPTQENEND